MIESDGESGLMNNLNIWNLQVSRSVSSFLWRMNERTTASEELDPTESNSSGASLPSSHPHRDIVLLAR